MTNLIFTERKDEFIKKYQYGKGIVDLCEYVISHQSGCYAKCVYCYLEKPKKNNIIIFNNYDKLLNEIIEITQKKKFVYFNAGENADSLFLDNITNLTKILVPFFNNLPNAKLELRTKSNNIKNLLKLNHNRNTIVAFTFSPQEIIEKYEIDTASLDSRIEAAKLCQEVNYQIGIRLDPIIHINNWQKLYENMIDKILNELNISYVYSISLGTLRLTKNMIRRFYKNKVELICDEFVKCEDDKFRYFKPIRIEIYQYLINLFKNYNITNKIYLSSETKEVWEIINGNLLTIFHEQ